MSPSLPIRNRPYSPLTQGVRLSLLLMLSSSAFGQVLQASAPTDSGASSTQQQSTTPSARTLWMTVGERRFAIEREDNEATRAFVALLPLTLHMSDLNDNEKHISLPRRLPTQSYRPGTIHNGDLMLYGADTLVVFYQTFDSPYSYTRLGRIQSPAGLAQVVGQGDVTIRFSAD